MYSLIPSLLTYWMFAPLLLRLTLSVVLLHWGYRKVRKNAEGKREHQNVVLGIVDLVAGVLLFIGLFTQFAALVAAIILAVKLVDKARTKALFTDGVNYYFILFIIAISLVFTGAGFIAADLRL